MNGQKSCNCIVCANEFDPNELHNIALSKINKTRFKICQSCLEASDPSEDYRQARDIINSYLWFAEARTLLKEALDDISAVKKEL